MAPSLGSRRLICFYCGRRSSRRYVEPVREWECENCEAVNYLDENGEITDPPVAIVEEMPSILQYARRSESPSFSPSSSDPDNALFCTDCLKNQHLVRSSLAQYAPEEQDTLAVDRNFLKFKESLEKRYPQVCEDCLPRVVERLKQSSYTAKTDHLRRLLDKTRQNVAPQKTEKTWLDVFGILGYVSWVVGVLGQLLWDFLRISEHLTKRYLEISTFEALSPVLLVDNDEDVVLPPSTSWLHAVLDYIHYNEHSWLSAVYHEGAVCSLAKCGLLLSLASIWWNPKFKEGYRGYHRHIKGFQDWYKYQALLLVVRVVFWVMTKYEPFDGADSSATVGVHVFMLGFTLSITVASRRCFRVDFSRLFAPISPERLLPYVGRREKSKYDGNDMSQALTSILDESLSSELVSSTTQDDPFFDDNLSGALSRRRLASQHNLSTRIYPHYSDSKHRPQPRDPRDLLGIQRTIPSLADMTPDESLQYLKTGEVPVRMQTEAGCDGAQDLMEWKPQNSQYRAFQPTQAPRQSQLFNQAPVVPDQSPFWYKGLPPAPISQAHKARNPPNVPRLQPRSLEAKQNLFNRVTGKQIKSPPPENTTSPIEGGLISVTPRRDIEFAQQKFFPPSATDAANGLSEMFEQAFTLKASDGEGKYGNTESAKQLAGPLSTERKRHLFTISFLFAALLGWNFSVAHPELDAMRVPLGIMIACGAIALRNIADGALNWSDNKISYLQFVVAILGGLQTTASGYAITEIVGGRGYCNTCRTQGAVLIGVMLSQEAFLVMFS